MALDPILWAMKHAPVADVEEWAVLCAMAEAADEDGCNAFQSTATIAERTRLSARTVQRRIDALAERGLILMGDQRAAEVLPAGMRPVVWDLQIPFSMFRDGSAVNSFRAGRGRPPLTPRDRPELTSAPGPKRRADLGKTKQAATLTLDVDETDQPGGPGGDYESPLTTSHPGDSQTPQGVTASRQGGVQQSPNPPLDPPQDPPLLLGDFAAEDGTDVVPAPTATSGKLVAAVPAFDQFWAIYPRKTGKDAARAAFTKALKRAAAEAIIAGAQRYASDPNLPSGDDRQFIPHASTWLNAGRWADEEPLPPRGRSGSSRSTGFIPASDADLEALDAQMRAHWDEPR